MLIDRDQIRTITPELLKADNSSFAAISRRERWYNRRSNGTLIVLKACSDSRGILPWEGFVHIQSVGSGYQNDHLVPLITDQRVNGLWIMSHQKGRTRIDDHGNFISPDGCGGRKAKEAQFNGSLEVSDELNIASFIDSHVQHPDVVINTWHKAEELAEQSTAPVLALSQNHLNGEIFRIAQFQDGGETIHTAVKTRYTTESNYQPNEIYKNGMPNLREDQLLPRFRRPLTTHAAYIDDLRHENPNLEEDQFIQDALVANITSIAKPRAIRTPHTLGQRNTTFGITIPRQTIEEKAIVERPDVEDALNQLEYAITHGIANVGQERKDFANLTTVYIDNRDIQMSEQIAHLALNRPWMQQFLQLPDRQIIVAGVESGVIQAVRKFDHAQALKENAG